jgi:hypothetical protein
MMDLQTRRHFFAEEIAAVANLKTPELVDALAKVPREAHSRQCRRHASAGVVAR